MDETPIIVLGRVVNIRNEMRSTKVVGLDVMRLGFTADENSPAEIKAGANDEPLSLTTGRAYLFFVNQGPPSDLRLTHGGQGVFEDPGGKVSAPRQSKVAEDWRQKPWDEFVKVVRERGRTTAR